MKIAAIFDLDGTILDTIDDIHDSLIHSLKYYGKEIVEITTTKRFIGNGIRKLVERAFGGTDNLDEYEKFFRAVYKNNMVKKTVPFPGILETLEYCINNGIICSVLSNKSFDMTDYAVKYFGMEKYFISWYGGDSFEEKKPSPLPVKKILDSIGDYNFSLIIGDNYTDIESGANAGIKSCFCSYGYGRLNEYMPDYKVDSPSGIIEVLKGLL